MTKSLKAEAIRADKIGKEAVKYLTEHYKGELTAARQPFDPKLKQLANDWANVRMKEIDLGAAFYLGFYAGLKEGCIDQDQTHALPNGHRGL
jgi:hypothetical protein